MTQDKAWDCFYQIRQQLNAGDSAEIERLFREYLGADNRRPSLVHSLILGLALKAFDANPNFRIFAFFKAWNPEYLRDEDYQPQQLEGREIRSLASRIIDRLVRVPAYKSWCDFRPYFSEIHLPDEALRDCFYDSFIRHLKRLQKLQHYQLEWQFLRLYSEYLITEAPHPVKNEVLAIACSATANGCIIHIPWFMESTEVEGYISDELVGTTVGVLFEAIKANIERFRPILPWTISTLEALATRQKFRAWTDMRRAMLMHWNRESEKAIEIMQSIEFQLGAKAVYWYSLGQMCSESVSASCFAKVIQMAPNAETTADAHYRLGKYFLATKQFEIAKLEFAQYIRIQRYFKHGLGEDFKDIIHQLGYIKEALKHENYPHYSELAKRLAKD